MVYAPISNQEKLVIDEVLEPLSKMHFNAYIVGGAVRDRIRNVPSKDVDVATSAKPEEIMGLFEGAKLITAQFSHVVTVPLSTGGRVEVATFREETDYFAGVPQTVQYVDDLSADLLRRDFRMNAMAMSKKGTVIDPHGGITDIQKKLISTHRNAYGMIEEHPIRMMRAARFAACMGFKIETNLYLAIKHLAHLIIQESWEAVAKEFMRGLGCDPSQYISILRDTGILKIILPEVEALAAQGQNVYHKMATVYEHTLSSLDAYYTATNSKADPLVALGILLHDCGKPAVAEYVSKEYGYSFHNHEIDGVGIANDVCRRLRLSNDETMLILLAVRHHMHPVTSKRTAKRFVNRIALQGESKEDTRRKVMFVLEVREADGLSATREVGKNNGHRADKDHLVIDVLDREAAFVVTDLEINGHDVMKELNIDPGPLVGDILNDLLYKVMDEEIANERAELLNECKQYTAPVASGI